MKVFATRFLEEPRKDVIITPGKWTWEPYNRDSYRIYASGGSTASRESTYANERDNRSDTDRPNEGSLAA